MSVELSYMPTDSTAPLEIHSEQRGPHWIAWVSDGHGKPRESVVLVGQTREEAEARARHWSQQEEKPA
jgi:hypothetical protein